MLKLNSTIILKVTEEMKTQLQEIADGQMITLSHLLRTLIMDYLKSKGCDLK